MPLVQPVFFPCHPLVPAPIADRLARDRRGRLLRTCTEQTLEHRLWDRDFFTILQSNLLTIHEAGKEFQIVRPKHKTYQSPTLPPCHPSRNHQLTPRHRPPLAAHPRTHLCPVHSCDLMLRPAGTPDRAGGHPPAPTGPAARERRDRPARPARAAHCLFSS